MGNLFSCLQKEAVPKPVTEGLTVREGRFPLGKPPQTGVPAVDTDTPDEVKDLIAVKDVKFNVWDDTFAHHTNMYELTDQWSGKDASLVIRRGKSFQMAITCDRPYDPEKDELKLIFQTGDQPMLTKGTLVEIVLSDADRPKQWGAKIVKCSDNDVHLLVMSPPTCPIGRWNVKVRAVKKGGGESRRVSKVFSHPKPIYMLFNPWCTDDQVYLHDEGLLDEYVLNDTGKIFIGVAKSCYGRPWTFAQFEDPVLDCVLSLLDSKRFPASSRGDPIKVVRKLTALVNSADENGILMGNWSGNYEGGVKPTAWTGSLAIMEEYYKTKSPVKYGQCWVFSAVLTTCCRALGLPTRSVTNFCSAHDTDVSISIDYHFDSEGEPMPEFNHDSVWNFHVWNDVWMARPDLKEKEYGGWQACDATPQETSDGLYCCGPCPLLAIKKGEVTVPYDGRFIFAEVNADKIYWQFSKDGELKKADMNRDAVGQNLSTLRPKCLPPQTTDRWPPCSDKRWENITSQYKYTEESGAERAAVMIANQAGSLAGLYEQAKDENKDVSVTVVDKEQCCYGDDLTTEVVFENLSKEERNVGGTFSLQSYYSTGVLAHQVRSEKINDILKPAEKVTKKMFVEFTEYNKKTIEGCYFKTLCVCSIKETNQLVSLDDDFRLVKPDLQLEVPTEVKVGEKFVVKVSFKNPLPLLLTVCSLEVEGPGLQKPKCIKQDPVGAKETFTYEMEMTASKPGTKTLVVSFDSKEIVDVNGSCEILVKDK